MTTATVPAAPEWKNLLGICAALGEDFGFNPLWLRIALGFGIIFHPVGVIAGYLAMGVVVAVSRLLAPNRRTPPVAALPERPAFAANSDAPPLARAA